MEIRKDFDIEVFNKWRTNTPLCIETDMDEKFRKEAIDIVSDGVEKSTNENGITIDLACKTIKEKMD